MNSRTFYDNIDAGFDLLLESINEALDKVLSGLPPKMGHTHPDLETLTRLALLRRDLLHLYHTWRGSESPRKRVPPERRLHANTDYTGKHVTGFTLGAQYMRVRSWREVLTGVCQMLYDENPRLFDEVCEEVRGRRPYFSRDFTAAGFHTPKPIAHSHWLVETNLNANTIVKIVYTLLAKCGHHPDHEFRLDFSP
ncbi:MAG: hypothetical protein OWU84_05530 [Firmicutes bacterium]|nr:hypothetical protein [Bacillota bacterium]